MHAAKLGPGAYGARHARAGPLIIQWLVDVGLTVIIKPSSLNIVKPFELVSLTPVNRFHAQVLKRRTPCCRSSDLVGNLAIQVSNEMVLWNMAFMVGKTSLNNNCRFSVAVTRWTR